MQLCTPHFGQLKDALILRGLWEHQTQTAEETEKLVRQINNADDEGEPQVFDCVLAAQMLMFDQAVKQAGDHLLELNDAGDSLCPLCQMRLQASGTDPDQWINGVCDDVLDAAHKLGVMKVQTRQ